MENNSSQTQPTIFPINVSECIYSACNLKMLYEQFTQNQLHKYNHAHKTSSCISKMHFLHSSSTTHLKRISHKPHLHVSYGKGTTLKDSQSINPEPLTHSHAQRQASITPHGTVTFSTAMLTQPTKKSFQRKAAYAGTAVPQATI